MVMHRNSKGRTPPTAALGQLLAARLPLKEKLDAAERLGAAQNRVNGQPQNAARSHALHGEKHPVA